MSCSMSHVSLQSMLKADDAERKALESKGQGTQTEV